MPQSMRPPAMPPVTAPDRVAAKGPAARMGPMPGTARAPAVASNPAPAPMPAPQPTPSPTPSADIWVPPRPADICCWLRPPPVPPCCCRPPSSRATMEISFSAKPWFRRADTASSAFCLESKVPITVLANHITSPGSLTGRPMGMREPAGAGCGKQSETERFGGGGHGGERQVIGVQHLARQLDDVLLPQGFHPADDG